MRVGGEGERRTWGGSIGKGGADSAWVVVYACLRGGGVRRGAAWKVEMIRKNRGDGEEEDECSANQSQLCAAQLQSSDDDRWQVVSAARRRRAAGSAAEGDRAASNITGGTG